MRQSALTVADAHTHASHGSSISRSTVCTSAPAAPWMIVLW